MILACVNVNAATGQLPQSIPVGRDRRRIVTHRMAQVEGIKGWPAAPPHSAHDTMNQSRDAPERRKLKQIVVLAFYQKQFLALSLQMLVPIIFPHRTNRKQQYFNIQLEDMVPISKRVAF